MRKYIKKNVKPLFLWLLFEINFAALMVIWSLIISRAMEAGMNGELHKLGSVLVSGIVFFLAMILSFYFQNLFSAKFVSRCTYDLKEDVFRSIVEADVNTHTDFNCAKYISIFNNDIAIIAKDYFLGVPAIIAQLILAVVATVTLFFYNPVLAVFEIVLSVITSVVPILVNKNGGKLQKKYTDALGFYNTRIKDYISAGAVLKSYHVEDKIREEHGKANLQVRDAYMEVEKKRGSVYAIITATRYMESALFLVFGSYLIAIGSLEVAVMLGAMQIVGYIANPVKQSVNLYTNYKRTKLLMDTIQSFLANIQENAKEKEAIKELFPISIDSLKFSYGENVILNNLSARFDKGKKYAICGESGCGKSTLIKVIMQQLTDYKGTVWIGKQDSRDVDKESFVNHFALIQQEVIMFEDSLRNNITMYGEFSEAEILEAVKAAGLQKFVDGLPDGLDSRIGENGANCSGGERQRITIARALLRKTPVLIMDEATSSLDAETSKQIEGLVLGNPSLTVIAITHKLDRESAKKYDKVYRLAEGVLKETVY